MNTSGIVPCGHRVLLLPDQVEEVTKGGIVVMTQEQSVKEQMGQIEGTVIAIGESCWKEFKNPWCKVGDRVIFSKYGGLIYDGKQTDDGKTYRIISDLDVVAVKEKGE